MHVEDRVFPREELSESFPKEVFFCGIYIWFKIFLEMPIYTLFSFKKSTLKHWKHFFGESKQTHSTPHEGFIFVGLLIVISFVSILSLNNVIT